ncbi:MAG: SoxR reducing system RseC family protein [Sulfuritalea sp.]|nr:SoxR reducing system RseC family protein [Sulfuritalea sp.]
MARMLHAAARIVSLQDGMALVRLDAPAACGSCGAQGACGGARARLFRVAVATGVGAGDRVLLQLPEKNLNRSALLAYLLPAATMLLGALLLAVGGDTLAALGAALGLGLGLICLRIFGRRSVDSGIRACHPNSTQGASP